MEQQNFIEAKTVQEANAVDLGVYTFVKHSDTRDVYIFKKRSGR